MLSEEDERDFIGERFRNLFKETQSQPEVADITDDEILAEIAAHRRSE